MWLLCLLLYGFFLLVLKLHSLAKTQKMANVLLTYDISQRHSEVKAALKAKGLRDSWTNENVKYNLPNTTMWKMGDIVTPTTVLADMNTVIADLNRNQPADKVIRLERCMSVAFAGWAGIPGEPHKS